MKSGTQADQILYEISNIEDDIKFLKMKLNECTSEKEAVYVLDAIDEAKKKLYKLKSM